jgi:hypothetical protein
MQYTWQTVLNLYKYYVQDMKTFCKEKLTHINTEVFILFEKALIYFYLFLSMLSYSIIFHIYLLCLKFRHDFLMSVNPVPF